MVFRIDLEGRLQMASPSFERLLGFPVEEALGMNITETLYEDPGKMRTVIRQLMETEVMEDVEARLKKKDDTRIWTRASLRIFFDDQHRPAGIDAIVRDITIQKEAERLRDLMVAVVEQAAEFIMVTDTEGRIVYVNPAFENGTGYQKEEVLGKTPRILKSGKQDSAFYQNLWETIATGHIWKGRLTNKRKDGSLFEEEATITPVKDARGKITSFVGMKRDVTREVRLETQLLQAQKMESIGTLAGGIAHDFNNILSGILGYTELCLIDTQDKTLLPNLEKILAAGNRAKDLVAQILTFSRQTEIKLTPVRVKPVVQEVAKFLRATLPSSIEISLECPSESHVLGDPTQIYQILMNLCSNAGYAMRESGGKLTIGLHDVEPQDEIDPDNRQPLQGSFIRLRVEDTGHGMTKEVASRIFDPFFTTKEKGQGTGMGLSVVHGIVKRYHGVIRVDSQPGKGTLFEIFLPVFQPKESRTGDSWIGISFFALNIPLAISRVQFPPFPACFPGWVGRALSFSSLFPQF